MTSTCNVLVTLVGSGGGPMVGASVKATLMAPMVADDVVVPTSVTSFTDYQGQCALTLYPSSAAAPPIPYRFEIVPAGVMRPTYFENIIVPNQPSVTLKQLLGWTGGGLQFDGNQLLVDGLPIIWS